MRRLFHVYDRDLQKQKQCLQNKSITLLFLDENKALNHKLSLMKPLTRQRW